MKSYLQSINEIHAPVEQVWSKIRRSDKVEDWHPLVSASNVKGNKRICQTEQGDLEETILTCDDKTRTFRYEIRGQKVYPAPDDIICTIKIVEGNNVTLMLWDIEFEKTNSSQLKETSDGFQTLIGAMASNLEKISK